MAPGLVVLARISAEAVVGFPHASFLSAKRSSAAGLGVACVGLLGETSISLTALPFPGGAAVPAGRKAKGYHLVALAGRLVVAVGSSSTAVVANAMALGYTSGDHIGRVLTVMRWKLESWTVVCGKSLGSVGEPFLLQP